MLLIPSNLTLLDYKYYSYLTQVNKAEHSNIIFLLLLLVVVVLGINPGAHTHYKSVVPPLNYTTNPVCLFIYLFTY